MAEVKKTVEAKSGWKSSEFWATMVANVLLLLAGVGVITAGQQTVLADSAGTTIPAIAVIIGAVNTAYAKLRTSAKKG